MTDSTAPALPAATILGYPRNGPDRELKKALEAYWAGRAEPDRLDDELRALRRRTRRHLAALGLSADGAVPAAFSAYDPVLDVATMLGAVPERFAGLVAADGSVDLPGYFALARGAGEKAPLEMTKWFDSNYHYLVPEIGPDTTIRYVDDRMVREFREGLDEGSTTRPVLVGPVTFLLLSKAAVGAPKGFRPMDRLEDVVGAYAHLLSELGAAGAPWVQIDEPALVADTWDASREEVLAATDYAYDVLSWQLARSRRPAILLTAPYGSVGDALPVLAASSVEAVGLDLVRGEMPSADVLATLAGKTVAAGVVDGRNIWRTDLERALDLLERLRDAVGPDGRVCVSTSTSLQHVPHDVEREVHLSLELRGWLAFADQKVGEVLLLADGLERGRGAIAAELAEAADARAARLAHPGVHRPQTRAELAGLDETAFDREPYARRAVTQQEELGLPVLPTTTIGSFPQTSEIRRVRAAHRRGELDDAAYEAAMRAEIEKVVRLQEELGLDVLVHGEPERNDMVQYFAELLDGFAVTQHGWVQSYGSRCTRPS
ncbi:5-methyltetrahydropteroyltriglutamate--homocysteine S-methyltransferase, partial [Georgenia subflava]